MSGCDRSLASAYRDGLLDRVDRASFEAHMSGCSGCQAAVADYAHIGRLMQALPVVVPPADLRRAVMTRAIPRRRPFWKPIVAGVASAAVVVFLGLSASQYLAGAPRNLNYPGAVEAQAPNFAKQPTISAAAAAPAPAPTTAAAIVTSSPTPPPCLAPAGRIAAVTVAVRDKIGCAKGGEISTTATEGVYQRGTLLRRADANRVYIITDRAYTVMTDTVRSPSRDDPFASFLDESGQLSALIGADRGPARIYPATVQEFDRATIVTTDHGTVYILYADRTWESLPG